jgi:hypothetical protein
MSFTSHPSLTKPAQDVELPSETEESHSNALQLEKGRKGGGSVFQGRIGEDSKAGLELSSHFTIWVSLPAEQVNEARIRHRVAMEIGDAVYHT